MKLRLRRTVADRIAAHKAMAMAALRANSSLSTRLARYNHHMACARALTLGANTCHQEVRHG